MCRYCGAASSDPSADRIRVLDLLALIERPDALPREAAWRIAAELLVWSEKTEPRLQCDAVSPAQPRSTRA